MRVVEVGQYFVTKDTGDFRQFRSVTCSEYTLPRDDPASQPKGWIQGNTRIGLVLEVTTSFQHFKYGIEIRIWSVGQDNSQSWVRISYGTNKYVIDSIEDNTEIPADPQEEQVPQTSTSVVAARSKAKAKPQPRESIGTTTIPLRERKWIDIEPSMQDLESYDLSKKVINLLRHNQKLHREEDGAIQFYRIKFHHQYCSDNLGSIIYLRALQGHSGSNLIDPALQDNVLIGPGIFPYIYRVGSNFNLYSIVRNGLVPGGQNLSRRQTVFFLPVDPRNEDHKDPEYIDYSAPRLARYLQNAWKRHQDSVFWVDNDLGIREGLMFYQTRSNAIILQGTLPAHCIVRAERLRTGEKLYERQYLSSRPPPKTSLKHDLNWTRGNDELGSTVEHRPVGKPVQQSLGETVQSGSSKPTQFPKPIEDRVNTIHPALDFHEHFTIQKGHGTLCQNFLRNSQICERLHQIRHGKSCRSSRRASFTNKHKCGCSQVKGKSKTSTESTKISIREESDQSSSTQSNVTARRRWSNSILQDKIPSTRPSSSNTKLV